VVERGVAPDGVVEVVDLANYSLHAFATRVEVNTPDKLALNRLEERLDHGADAPRPHVRLRLSIPRLIICIAKVAPGLSVSIFCMEADDEPISEVCGSGS
jgi:hypothetical protein